MVRKQAVGGGAEGGIGGSQRSAGAVAPGGVAAGVLVGGQGSGRGKGGSRGQGAGQVQLRGGRVAAWIGEIIKSQDENKQVRNEPFSKNQCLQKIKKGDIDPALLGSLRFALIK